MSAHTPGPWTFCINEYGTWTLLSASGESFQGNARYYPYVSDNKADWVLQAEAPELLAALTDIIAESTYDDYPNTPEHKSLERGRAVLAKFAKAEGKAS